MNCLLAIDSGGTKCAALLTDLDGNVLGRGYCHASSVKVTPYMGGRGRSLEAISAAALQAVGGRSIDTLHLVLINTRYLSRQLTARLGAQRVRLIEATESDAAYGAANETCGIVVLSGTGAFVHAETRAGKALRLDGLGPMLGDFGSAYYIGTQGLKAAASAEWSPRRHTVLRERICKACNVPLCPASYSYLIRYAHGYRDRSEIAALARLVDEAAVEGDAVAVKIMDDAVAALGETVRDMVTLAKMGRSRYPLIGIGSVIKKSRLFWPALCAYVHTFAPLLQPVLPKAPAVAGMAIRGLQKLDGPGVTGAVARLREFDWVT